MIKVHGRHCMYPDTKPNPITTDDNVHVEYLLHVSGASERVDLLLKTIPRVCSRHEYCASSYTSRGFLEALRLHEN